MSEALQAAIDEGLVYFWAHTHTGQTWRFVGSAWEEGGFTTDDGGNPIHDPNGNTIAKWLVESLDGNDRTHLDQCEIWYSGESR